MVFLIDGQISSFYPEHPEVTILRERPLMTSDIRVGRGSKIAPKKGRYRAGQGR